MHAKGFQIRSAAWIDFRLFEASDAGNRFLLADEVGLGKTVVAAEVIRHLHQRRGRRSTIIVYMCSNMHLSQQNAGRLGGHVHPIDRFGMLPALPLPRRPGEATVVPVTFNTSASPRGRGAQDERAVLMLVCHDALGLTLDSNVQSFFSYGVSRWERTVQRVRNGPRYRYETNHELCRDFASRARALGITGKVLRIFVERCAQDSGFAKKEQRRSLEQLRGILNKAAVARCLRPDLVILDEFQRFDEVITAAEDPSTVAGVLLNRHQVRTVLLSATPFKMYTTVWEEVEEHHYSQLMQVLRFLLWFDSKRDERLRLIGRLFQEFRRSILDVVDRQAELVSLLQIKRQLETELARVMARTERRALGGGVEVDSYCVEGELSRDEVQHYAWLRRAAGNDYVAAAMAYWQSAPFVLTFFDRQYAFKRQLLTGATGQAALVQLASRKYSPVRRVSALPLGDLKSYPQFHVSHLRMRRLLNLCFQERKAGRWLWLPPSKHYWQPAGAFVGAGGASKLLVFSHWRAVPRAIAALVSYEVERDALQGSDRTYGQKALTPLSLSGKHAGSVFLLHYPSRFLARAVHQADFLALAKSGPEPTWARVRQIAVRKIREALAERGVSISRQAPSRALEHWKWLVTLDAWDDFDGTLAAVDRMTVPQHTSDDGEDPREFVSLQRWRTRFSEQCKLSGELPRTIPAELLPLLADISLCSPATTLFRSLLGLFPDKAPAQVQADLMSTAISGLRSWLSGRVAYPIIQKETKGKFFWQQVLEYCRMGNLQSVWDEYLHLLHEELRSQATPAAICSALQVVLGLRDRSLRLENIRPRRSDSVTEAKLRVHFALPFTDSRGDEQEFTQEHVRQAFNSPFWPYVLATTSAGQEGLDFHRYCREIVHWNLPHNPVDFEQREGRINRYKGLAIRQAIGAEFTWTEVLSKGHHDLWQGLFESAIQHVDKPDGAADLWPSWVFRGRAASAKLSRYIWFYPFSRERERYRRLLETLVLYRLAFGQPDQTDFLETLRQRAKMSGTELLDVAQRCAINLQPPLTE